ncbi:helix-turn-helix transcriptional regulator [Actinocorallia longicatena]|uniref:LuxR family transcriptional regulator n=1 Tax=Actinocorallia longicatena TaxID=111803 RepID=A0ABP6Q333_9ACTN
MIVLDDVQWVDTASLLALTFMLRRLRADRVLTIITARDLGALSIPTGLRRLLEDDRTVRLRLAGLPAGELRRFGRSIGGLVLSGAAAVRLRAFTEGNPLHARELMERFPAEVLNDLARPLPAPPGHASLVLTRFADCGPAARAFISAASVLPTPAAVDRIAELTGDDPLAALDEATRSGLMEERPDKGGLSAAFPHPLVQAAIYNGIGPASRHRLHSRAAGFATSEPQRLHHRVRATTGQSSALADELVTLAHDEQRTGHWSSAGTHLIHAARLEREEERKGRFIGEAIYTLVHSGRVEEACELERTLPSGSPPEIWAFAHGLLAQVSGRSGEATRLLTEAWNRTDLRVHPRLACRTAEHLAMLTMMTGDSALAAVWAERALAGPATGFDSGIVRGIRLLSLAATGSPAEALHSSAGLPPAAAGTREDRDLLVGRGTVRLWTGDLDGAVDDLRGLLRCADHLSAYQRVVVHAHMSHALHLAGDWDDALVHSEIATTLAVEGDQLWMIGGAFGLAALVPAKRGDWETAEHQIAQGRRVTRELVASRFYVAVAEAWLETSRGNPERLIEVLTPFLELDQGDGLEEPGLLDWRDLLSDALTVVGELDRALAVLAPFERAALARTHHMALARVYRAKGILLAASGDDAEALRAFELGLHHCERNGSPFDRARLQLACGGFLRRKGSRNAAAERFEAAHRTFAALRAAPYQEQCERELIACGRAVDPAQLRWNLTAQELAVARLVATGRGNQQVGRELMLSVKTVEYHLGHVYTKLGLANRAELAARFATAGQ